MNRKNKNRIFALVGASVMGATLLAGCKDEESPVGNLTVKVLPTTQKVMLDEDISSLAEGAVNIEAAKGESDAGQFIVRCDEDVKEYDVTITDFISGGNTISAENVEICKQVYTYCSDTLAYDGVLKAGYYPDALIPLEYIQKFDEDVIKKGENQGIWLDIDVPKDAQAGNYSATVTFTYNGNGKVDIPVTLTVYDFVIRDTPYFKSTVSLRNNFNSPQDYWLAIGELSGTDEMELRYYDKLVEYNCDGGALPADTVEDFVKYVRQYYDNIASYRLPYSAKSNTENDWAYMRERMGALIEASIQDGKNYFDKAYYRLDMFYDEYMDVPWREPLVEPTIQGCEDLEKELVATYQNSELINDSNRAFVQEVLNTVSNLRHHMTAWFDDKYGEYINLCCPLFPKFQFSISLDEAQALRESNDVEWWSYGCVMSDTYPSPTWEIDDYALTQRDLLWFDYENDIMGSLFWCATSNCNYGKVNSDFNVYTLLDDFYTVASHEGLTNGDGYLLYPGAPYDSDEPFASMRLAIYRDGIDDHTYMGMLGEAYENMTGYGADYQVKDAKSFVSFMNEQMLGRNASKLDYGAVFSARRALAGAVELVQKEGFVIDMLSIDTNTVSYSFYAKNGDTVSLNGNVLTGTASGDGVHYTGTIAIPENRSLTLKVNDKEIALTTPPQAQVLNDYNTFNEKDFYFVNKQYEVKDVAVENTDGAFALSGNSAKITLNGRTAADGVDVTTYKPKFALQFGKYGKQISDIWSIEFYVYNPSDEDMQATVYLEGTDADGVTHSADYDIVLLKAHSWKKIVIDNFNVVSINKEEWNQYGNKVGLKLENPLNSDGTSSAVELYVDNLLVRAR